jgi:dolichyl-phosphate beta-glucosyltransferase
MHLSVIIPAYKEAERIPKTLDKVKEFLSKQSYDWEVIVVNDGSPDKTAEIVSEWIKSKSQNQNFKLIDNPTNKGKGGVVKQGLLEARGDWRLVMDADSSTDIKEVDKLLPYTDEFECVIGSRYLQKDSIKVKQPFYRRAISRIGNILIRVMLGIKSVDTQCGFKLYSAGFSKKIIPLQRIMRWGFDSEILAIGIKKGYKIKEVPVDWYDDSRTTVKKSAAIQTLKEIFAIKWNMIRGKYS